jgi:3-phenylpropionate/cinnamic acid dioxygenase small subunit
VSALAATTSGWTADSRQVGRLLLRQSVEDFLFREAELLDDRRYEEWLETLDEDLVYFMPLRRNVRAGEHAAKEDTRIGKDLAWFEDDKWTLSKRVAQIRTGSHWAEEPFSRVCHMVSNVQIVSSTLDEAGGVIQVEVVSRFMLYQNREEYETNVFVGKRRDILRRHADSWRLLNRRITLDQSVLQAKYLTVFF